jgi:hypothetical protein
MAIKHLHQMAPPPWHRKAIPATHSSTRRQRELWSEPGLREARWAGGRATKTSIGAHRMPRLPTRREERNRTSPTTWHRLDPGPGRQVRTTTRRAPTTMRLLHNTACMAMAHTEANSPSFGTCKLEETPESRGRRHSPSKATRALPPISSRLRLCVCISIYRSSPSWASDGSILVYPPYTWRVWTAWSSIP